MFVRRNCLGLIVTLVLAAGNLSAQTNPRTAVGIFLDNSGSMFSQISRQQTIANAIVRAKAGSAFSLFGFASPKPLSIKFAAGIQCSIDASVVTSHVDAIEVARGKTVLIDALQSAVAIMNNPEVPLCQQTDERILVLMTDGEDRASEIKPDELMEFVKARRVKLYIIGLLRDMADEAYITASPRKKSKSFLLKLAKDTGGRVVFPKDDDKADKIVENLFSESYVLPK